MQVPGPPFKTKVCIGLPLAVCDGFRETMLWGKAEARSPETSITAKARKRMVKKTGRYQD